MNGIKPTIDSLALLVTLDDPAGEAVAAQRIDEFVAFNPNIDRKIENLELLRQAMVPMAPWAEDSPQPPETSAGESKANVHPVTSRPEPRPPMCYGPLMVVRANSSIV